MYIQYTAIRIKLKLNEGAGYMMYLVVITSLISEVKSDYRKSCG
jgi:hypothetical protein